MPAQQGGQTCEGVIELVYTKKTVHVGDINDMQNKVFLTDIASTFIVLQLICFACFALPIGNNATDEAKPTNYSFPRSRNGSIECFDLGPNCHQMKDLCHNATFEAMLRRECALTCNHCEPVEDNEEKLMPNIQTEALPFFRGNETKRIRAKSSSSLSKTIIKGTCFDEYIYCGEFRAMCNHEDYRELMARHCALSCNRCEVQHKERETCEDYVECKGLATLCQHPVYHDLLRQQCKVTCNVCTPETEGCMDRHKNCPAFKRDGFCENPIYTEKERKYLCGHSCGLCKED
uniref:ShTK domain protein n=1 Tax=Panagrellus redivivus TaxID=6233 RepID=A0A7E4W7C9_PANRE